MRAGSSGLGRLGLGLVALCLVEAVDQRLDDELDRQLVDILHVLRISVLQRAFHRIQKWFLDFLEAETFRSRVRTVYVYTFADIYLKELYRLFGERRQQALLRDLRESVL